MRGPATTDRIGNHRGSHEKKLETARRARAAGLPLTINAPIHRHNIEEVPEFIELALSLGAERLEIANVQYAGWALVNRDALMPDRAAVERQAEIVRSGARAARRHHEHRLRHAGLFRHLSQTLHGRLGARCLHGGAGRHGAAVPCRADDPLVAASNASVPVRSTEIWTDSPAFNAFRGTDWMQEPCRSCERREIDWGGCRCQAMAIAGDAAATDPACVKSPIHARMAKLVDAALAKAAPAEAEQAAESFVYRRIGAVSQLCRTGRLNRLNHCRVQAWHRHMPVRPCWPQCCARERLPRLSAGG